MAGKYTPLGKHLIGLSPPTSEITLTFEQIERILNDKLPQSAYHHRAWWGNEQDGSHVNAQAWMDAGWKVESVSLPRRWVRFVRI